MPSESFVAMGALPDAPETDPGQVVEVGRAKDKLLALRLVKPLHRGAEIFPCSCGARFVSDASLAGHNSRRHSAPPPAPKPAAAPAAPKSTAKPAAPAPEPTPTPEPEAPADTEDPHETDS